MWLAEKHLAVFKARNLPVHLPILLADTEQNLNDDVENGVFQTRLVLLAKKTLGGGVLDTVTYHEGRNTLQLGELSDSPSHGPEGGNMIAMEQMMSQEVAGDNSLADAGHYDDDDDDIILLNPVDVAKMAYVVYGSAC
jgi:hypothetical protein